MKPQIFSTAFLAVPGKKQILDSIPSRVFSIVATTASLALTAGYCLAQTNVTWDGDGNGTNGKNWGNDAAWVGNVVPLSTDNAIFGDLAYASPPYQPSVNTSNGNGSGIFTIAGVHFNNATAATVLTAPASSSLTVTGATLVSQSATVTIVAGPPDGVFSTNSLSIVPTKTFTIPSVSIAGRLSGQGTITGNVVISGTHSVGGSISALGATYAPGIGSQTVGGSLTYSSASIFSWDLLTAGPSDPGLNTSNSGSYDQVSAGSVTGAGSIFDIVLNGSGSFSDDFWKTDKSWTNIFTAGGSPNLATIFTTFSGTGVSSGGFVSATGGTFSFSGTTLNYSVVPETTGALAGLLLGVGLLRRRRA